MAGNPRSGKMSMGMLDRARTAQSATATMTTMMVTGRRKAEKRIHMMRLFPNSVNEAPRSKLRGITELNSEDFSEGEANPVASYGECQVQKTDGASNGP